MAASSKRDQTCSGISAPSRSRFRRRLDGFAVPIRTVATAGCRRGNRKAAAASVTPASLAIDFELVDAMQNVLVCRTIIEMRTRDGTRGENAGIKDAADHQGRPGLRAKGQQRCSSGAVEQRVATCEQDTVERRTGQHVEAHLHLVHSQAVGRDGALAFQFVESLQASLEEVALVLSIRLRAMRIGTDIVNECDIDAIEAETREAEFHRSHDAIIRIVVIHRERQGLDIAVVRHLIFRNGSQQPAHFCRKDIGFAWLIAQEIADTPFRQAETVERRGVEVADPRVPGDSEGLIGVLPSHGAV